MSKTYDGYELALMRKSGNARELVKTKRDKPRKQKPEASASKARIAVAPQTRMYQTARVSRLTSGFGSSTTSADSELTTSLTVLRNRSRALVRDAAYAKRAKVVVQNNVIGSGMGMQAQVMSTRDTLREDVNTAIEDAWRKWSGAEYCHTGGALHFCDFERAAMGQVFEAGEVFIRKHARSFGGSEIPFALELIEGERLADDLTNPAAGAFTSPDTVVKMGVEQDRYGRPVAYWIRQRHPGEFRLVPGETDMLERVPADQIIHLRLIDRWPQTRGEPWLHAVARKLNDMDGYSEAEIIAARADATAVFTIQTPDDKSPLGGQLPTDAAAGGTDIQKEFAVEAGMGMRLAPGEEFAAHTPKRPNSALDPFMRYMLREVAAGTGVSYESLSRDYSQSNYSSSRLAVLDDRDLWKMLQQWWIRNLRLPLHREWLQAAVLSRAITAIRVEEYALAPDKFEAVRFKPRGWSWVDPKNDVESFESAVKGGFTTVSDVIAATADGRDLEDVLRERRRELDMMKQLDLEFTTSPDAYAKEEPAPAAPPAKVMPPDGEEEDTPARTAERVARAVGGAMVDLVRSQRPPQALVTVEQPDIHMHAPHVNVKAGDVHIAPPAVTLQPPDIRIENRIENPAPTVNVAAPEVRIENQIDVPATTVNVAAPEVRIENQVDVPATVVNVPEANIHVAAPEVRIENKVEVPQVTESVSTYERDEHDEIREVRTVTVR